MRRLIILVTLWIFPAPAISLAWNLSDHREISEHALENVSSTWRLTAPCEIHPLQALLDKLRPLREELGDSWHFSNYLQVNPAIDLGRLESYRHPGPAIESRKTLTPLEILTFYSTDPDDGRDQNLFFRDEKGNLRASYPDQKWFGSPQGSSSQAFRHIEKPPFHLLHPLATMGFPPWHVGEATRRAEIYFQLSRLAFLLDEDYWGWRFLANSFHYLEDLHNPYHAGQLTPTLFKKGIQALKWGCKTKGFIGTFGVVVSNSHRFFESYVATPRAQDGVLKAKTLIALKGEETLPLTGSVESMAKEVRDASNLRFGELTKMVSEIADPRLDGPYEFQSDGDQEDDPSEFVHEGPHFEEANQQIFEIVRERFASAGKVLRTEVKEMIDLRREDSSTTPAEVLSQLDSLLGPPPEEENP